MSAKQNPRSDDADVRAAMAAMRRAADSARKTAIATETAIIIVRDGKRVRVTAEELRQQQPPRAS